MIENGGGGVVDLFLSKGLWLSKSIIMLLGNITSLPRNQTNSKEWSYVCTISSICQLIDTRTYKTLLWEILQFIVSFFSPFIPILNPSLFFLLHTTLVSPIFFLDVNHKPACALYWYSSKSWPNHLMHRNPQKYCREYPKTFFSSQREINS